MNWKALMALVGLLALFLGIGYQNYFNSTNFDLPEERIIKDLNGKGVPTAFNQYWPFELNQNIKISVIGTRETDGGYTIVMVEVSATASVDKSKNEKELPSDKMQLRGVARLTYEFVAGEWYLLNIENISLKLNFV